MRPVGARLGLFGLVALLIGVAVLAIPQALLPAQSGWWRSFQTPPVAAVVTFSQTFVMTADGLSAVEFETVRTGVPGGNVRIELRELTRGSAPVVREAEVPADDLVDSSTYRFAFAPVNESGGRTYRVDVGPSATRPPSGVALSATKGPGYSAGTLLVNDRERWADLVFRVHSRTAASSLDRLLDLPPAGVSRGYMILGSLIAMWTVLGVALRLLWLRFGDSEPFRVAPRR